MGIDVYFIRPRGVINPVMSRLLSSKGIWSYSENKSIKKATLQPAKSSENSSALEGKLASFIVTRLISVALLISRYFFPSPFLTKNYEFRYKSWHCSITPLLSLFLSISVTVPKSDLGTGKPGACHILCSIVLIFYGKVIFGRILPQYLNFHATAASLRYNISTKIFFSSFVNCFPICIFASLFGISREPLAIIENFGFSYCSNRALFSSSEASSINILSF